MNHIPKVRRWRVRFYMERTLLADMVVETINKRFARWLACERIRADHLDRYMATSKITVSPMER